MTDQPWEARCCDLVMKGGITSGILYPPAICRIAEKFTLVGIGGTSAGAIAACVAAAAEYRRRQTGSSEGFEYLEQMPRDLAQDGRMTSLFRPDQPTRKLHGLLLQSLALEDRSLLARVWFKVRMFGVLARHKKHLQALLDNHFGLCSGMAVGNRGPAGELGPLTPWLHARIQEVAGRAGGPPLTFGELRGASIPDPLSKTMAGNADASIDLRMVSTCLTFARPYELPFQDNVFAFDPEEWKGLFPDDVVAYLTDSGSRLDAPMLNRDGKIALASRDAMPVIVAARMSLSFPGLFTMVPLYAVNYEEEDKPLEKVWFSDGGITSNFPIHRYDSIFPRWPTLGINLMYTDDSGRPARRGARDDLVYMPQTPGGNVHSLPHRFAAGKGPVADLLGFIKDGIFRSAQVWHDNGFLRLPGFNDRVVEIWLRPDEGGMNLVMPEQTIHNLVERGNKAGESLCARFADAGPGEQMSWEGHRWTRYRSAMAGLANALHTFYRNVDQPMPGDRNLHHLLANEQIPPRHKYTGDQIDPAREATLALLELMEGFAEMPVCTDGQEQIRDRPFCKGPRPRVEIGVRAPMS